MTISPLLTSGATTDNRDIVFISKATPEDDEFVLWLAPRLEAEGYRVFADILTLEPGDRWRREITDALQNRAVKMLLCCRDSTLAKVGVQEEIGIALDLVKELKDSRFLIPLRLAPYKKLFGIGELQWIDFVGSWAAGLRDLLDALQKQNVPRNAVSASINPNWELYRRRAAIQLEAQPELLTSNWLRIAELPEVIHYYYPPGPINLELMERACRKSHSPAEAYQRGFFSFADPEEINLTFEDVAIFEIASDHDLSTFLEGGSASPGIGPREAKNVVLSMVRHAWEEFLRSKELIEFRYSSHVAFHASEVLVPLGKRVAWGRQGQKRSSMLRNTANGKVWQYGVSGIPSLWPFPHIKLKARVLFAEAEGTKAGPILDDAALQHRLRRKVCKGWRNKAWHGRLMAFCEVLSDDGDSIHVPLSETSSMCLEAQPTLFRCPVSTVLQDTMPDDAEESDDSTLGNFDPEDDE